VCSPIYKDHTDLTSTNKKNNIKLILFKACVRKKNLILHLTTRTDDSHAIPIIISIKNLIKIKKIKILNW